MKKVKKILIKELVKNYKNQKLIPEKGYFNSTSGNISILLTSILEKNLLSIEDSDSDKWLDDMLLSRVVIVGLKIKIWGITIWGKSSTTKQWTDPVYIEINLNEDWTKITKMKFLYQDKEVKELDYMHYRKKRGFWDKEYYSDHTWIYKERDWKYKFKLE